VSAALAATDPPSPLQQPTTRRAFVCRCGQPVFFRNSQCVVCKTPLGYDAELALLLPLDAEDEGGSLWHAVGPAADADPALAARRYRRCANFDNAAGCNWLLPALADEATPEADGLGGTRAADDPAAQDADPKGGAAGASHATRPDEGSGSALAPPRRAEAGPETSGLSQSLQAPGDDAPPGVASAAPAAPEPAPTGAVPRQTLCRACRLNRTIPDQAIEEHRHWWAEIERAKRRLVSSLIALRLPVASRVSEDPARGLAFDLLRAPSGGPPVTTGHADGIITLDVEEADDSRRERRKAALHEPYRTLLGHLRHEVGHYYWQRLVDGTPWLQPFRALFGDERADYAAALQRHYEQGPPAEWPLSHVSAYASAHPWEDWAETWAHYLHMLDTLDTAVSFGLDAAQVELGYEPFTRSALASAPIAPAAQATAQARPSDAPGHDDEEFLAFVNAWMKLTGVLNELSRSMGLPDFYPFVLSVAAVRKLHLVHRVVSEVRAAPRSAEAA